MRWMILGVVGLALAACAGQAPREVRTGEIYQRHAAQEETSSVLFGFVRSWRRAGDDSLLIEFNRNRHYLFELEPRCALEIPFANSIALLSSTSQRIDRFDRIRVGDETCRIISIREVDMDAVRADLERLRQGMEPALDTVETDVIHADNYSGGT